MNRRRFIFGVLAAGAGAVVLWGILPPRQRLRGSHAQRLNAGEIALNSWITLSPEGICTLAMPRSEMGQGVHTGLAMLAAEELDCGWHNLRIANSPIDKIYGNVAGLAEGVPFHPADQGVAARGVRWIMHKAMRELGFMMTGGSASIRDLWEPIRSAAAMARASVLETVAAQWQVSAAEISLNDGVLSRGADQRMTLGEALERWGQNMLPAKQYRLKEPARFQIIGQPLMRTDTQAKTTAQALFADDVREGSRLCAALRLPARPGDTLNSLDEAKAKALPGVRHIVRFEGAGGGSGGVAVLAQNHHQAMAAAQALDARWNAGPMTAFSTVNLEALLLRALDTDDGFTFWREGDAQAALANAAAKLEATYRAPYLAHATLEPMVCTIRFQDGRATLWAPTQVPDFARRAAAKALRIDEEKVEIVVTYLGGGFGRRLEVDYVAQAAQIAKQVPGEIISVQWNREQDLAHDFYRPACLARFAAGLDRDGRLVAWHNKSAGQAIVPQYMPRAAGLPVMGPDKTASEGAFDQVYEFPNAAISHVRVDLPVPVGFWRAVGHSHQAFFQECFMDECAHAAKADPLEFRLRLLSRHARHAAVLRLAAQKAGWGTPLAAAPDGAPQARGLALHESFGSIVAQVAEVSLDNQRNIRVHRVVCALDCGVAVNPNLIAQQMESAVIFGLSAALHGRIDFDEGVARQTNFHDYPVLRMHESPVIETHMVPSAQPPGGIGEPGLPPIAPAVGNAVFALTGQRLRALPFQITRPA